MSTDKGQMPTDSINFSGRRIGAGFPVFVIAEAGLNHNGSLKMALQLVDAAKQASADCVKFQKRDVSNLAISDVLEAEDRRFPSLGSTYRGIRERLEFGEAEYREIIQHCRSKEIQFLCTAFDIASIEFLSALDVGAFKLASHSLTNMPLIECAASTRKPVFLSTGMCTFYEIDRSVEVFQKRGTPLALFHCVSVYPHKAEEANLSLMDAIRERYQVPVGYSGHELGHLPTLVAVARGAAAIERHFTMDKTLEGFDHRISLEPHELSNMIRDIRMAEASLGTRKKEITEAEWTTRRKYHVSIVSKAAIAAGTLIEESMLGTKNPGLGIESYLISEVVGRRTRQNIPADSLIQWEMLEKS